MIEHYYNYVKNELASKYKHIHSIDTAGRIYHALTNTNREFKQFLNIAISADCKNSHPVLFCYFMMKWRGISIEDSFKITSIMHSITNISDVRETCCSVVDKLVINRLSNDELEYIYLTSNGLLWDTVAEKHPEIDRNEVKEKMFAEVFYSNDKETRCWQEYAKEFQEQFPRVIELIKYWKNSKAPDIHKYLSDNGISTLKKATSALSMAMMNLEAQIFVEILKRIYRKRWYAVHIHDCIIIPKTKSKNQPKKEQVIKIMQEVYKEYGLAPSFD